MSGPYFFGYGSLVNRATHDYANAHPARIEGWRRAWRHVEGRKVAFLSAVPDPTSAIDGLIAHVPDGDWSVLDMREHSYARILATDVAHEVAGAGEIHIYHAPDDMHVPAREMRPVLLSYIDVVVQGYLREFGEDGVARFFQTTDGWDAPVRNDRTDPVYPRHQRLHAHETALTDDWLAELGVVPV
ncbi:MAG: gamma-glutamylcyclotransferase [Silicimonas sp.]|nr:gamma-glutamylcyclotransferase [Silicimonas sp.]NNL36356.1 gamma-glutamylcyclotransferase [Silicimonas sp.]